MNLDIGWRSRSFVGPPCSRLVSGPGARTACVWSSGLHFDRRSHAPWPIRAGAEGALAGEGRACQVAGTHLDCPCPDWVASVGAIAAFGLAWVTYTRDRSEPGNERRAVLTRLGDPCAGGPVGPSGAVGHPVQGHVVPGTGCPPLRVAASGCSQADARGGAGDQCGLADQRSHGVRPRLVVDGCPRPCWNATGWTARRTLARSVPSARRAWTSPAPRQRHGDLRPQREGSGRQRLHGFGRRRGDSGRPGGRASATAPGRASVRSPGGPP